ncbi:hypothetical protein [Paraburkholderia sediminicola]|uniref:hypothetical protein n=1 Tax=Paraburkholderia sediminicola TaxID=458836 RepID=UPI0038B90A82
MMDDETHCAIVTIHARRESQRLSLIVRASAATLEEITRAGAGLHEMGCEIALLSETFPANADLLMLLDFIASTQIEAEQRAREMARIERLTSGATLH